MSCNENQLLNQIDILQVMKLTYFRKKHCWSFYEICFSRWRLHHSRFPTKTKIFAKFFDEEFPICWSKYQHTISCIFANIQLHKHLNSKGISFKRKCTQMLCYAFIAYFDIKYILRLILSWRVYCIPVYHILYMLYNPCILCIWYAKRMLNCASTLCLLSSYYRPIKETCHRCIFGDLMKYSNFASPFWMSLCSNILV